MKKFKILQVLIISLILVGTVFAGISTAQEALPSMQEPEQDISENSTRIAGKVGGVLQVLGIVIAVISMGILGIKYMIGSVEEKAQYKKSMILYIAGAIFITLTGFILQLVNKLTNESLK